MLIKGVTADPVSGDNRAGKNPPFHLRENKNMKTALAAFAMAALLSSQAMAYGYTAAWRKNQRENARLLITSEPSRI
jgi:hypothetical protein